MEGYTGSDVKEVCREAVVRISNEQAKKLDQNNGVFDSDSDGALREVEIADFTAALKKLKKSVSETGKGQQKIESWNDEFGEMKKKGSKKKMGILHEIYL